VFGGASVGSAAEQTRSWEQLKALERAARGGDPSVAGTLSDVPRALPALVRAAKLGRRASRVGFDWQDARQVREKVMEELAEVDAAAPASPQVAEELGDLLFALANWSRHLNVDAEVALRGANAKFERRFRLMEEQAREQGRALESLTAGEWEALWEQAKKCETD
jgi:MazG family protein